MTINDRIKDIRRSTGLSQTDFAERLGTTRGVITNLEGEKTTPNEPFIKLICREFNIDEHWLRTGEGEMRQKLTRNQEIAEFMGVVMHDPDDAPRKRFVSIISKLSADEWQLLAEIAKKWPRTNNRPRPIFLFPRLCDQLPHESPDQIQIRICGQPQQALDLFQQQIPFHFHKCLHSSTKISSIFVYYCR